MNALILNGDRPENVAAESFRDAFTAEFGRRGFGVESVSLPEMDIAPCLGCFGCWTRNPGLCLINDTGRDVARKIIQCDVMILLTPITFGGYCSHLKKALDRALGNLLPFFMKIDSEIHHKPRYEDYPRWVVVGFQNEPDDRQADIFRQLVARNSLNWHSPSFAVDVVPAAEAPSVAGQRVKAVLTQAGFAA